MESETQLCNFAGRHEEKRLAVKIMRSTCPNYPKTCSYYRIKVLCSRCVEYVQSRIDVNDPMHCVECKHLARASTFWSIVGDV